MDRNTPTFDALKRLSEQLGGVYELRVEGLSEESRAKLAGLAKTGRPFLQITRNLQQQAIREVKAALAEVLTKAGNVRVDRFLEKAGEGAKAIVLLRFKHQGNDVSLKPLDAEYRAYKRKHGLDPRIGVATGALLRDLQGARFVFERAG